MMKRLIIPIVIASIWSVPVVGQIAERMISTSSDTVIAGETMRWDFPASTGPDPVLRCYTALGAFNLKASTNDPRLVYELSGPHSERAGLLHWSIQIGNEMRSGDRWIVPGAQAAKVETYTGPESIRVGTDNFSMMIASALDSLDNPLSDGASISMSSYSPGRSDVDSKTVSDMIAVDSIDPGTKSGQIIATVWKDETSTKEIEITSFPGFPIPFLVYSESVHQIADGHQLIVFSTSQIQDRYANIVPDGTRVQFIIRSNSDGILQAFGNTSNGFAKTQLTHPEREDKWNIQAKSGKTTSENNLEINFQAAAGSLPLHFDDAAQIIEVGPVVANTGQWLPDGMRVKFAVSSNQKQFFEEVSFLQNGKVELDLRRYDLIPGTYLVSISCAGLEKDLNISLTENE